MIKRKDIQHNVSTQAGGQASAFGDAQADGAQVAVFGRFDEQVGVVIQRDGFSTLGVNQQETRSVLVEQVVHAVFKMEGCLYPAILAGSGRLVAQLLQGDPCGGFIGERPRQGRGG